MSIQTSALMYGNYVSQLAVRSSAGLGPGVLGQILAKNAHKAAEALALNYEEFDHKNKTRYPRPQGQAYLKWIKSHLVEGAPVVWFIVTKPDLPPLPPVDGQPMYSHIEPVWGIYSNHPLSDATVYDDDVIVHGSDWDQNSYYRRMDSLIDKIWPISEYMQGNCKNETAVPGGPNEAYPCVYDEEDYGIAILGNVDPKGVTYAAVLQVDNHDEPNVSQGAAPVAVKGELTVSGLTAGERYVIYRYDSLDTVPRDSVYPGTAEQTYPFTPSAATHVFQDPKTFLSNSTTFYRVVKA